MIRGSRFCGATLALTMLSLWVLSAGTALAQRLGQGGDTGLSWWRIVGALALCLLLAFAAALALKARMQGGRLPRITMGMKTDWLAGLVSFKHAPRQLRQLESLRVGQNVEVCLFVCDDRQFLIAATPGGVVLLKEAAAPSTDAS